MKLTLEKKILIGFVINLLVVITSGWIFIARIGTDRETAWGLQLNWIEGSLFVLSIILLIVVYFIIKTQLREKKSTQKLLNDNSLLIQAIIDNTSNPIFIKKISGEYLLTNKQFNILFDVSEDNINGRTDYDFLPKTIADAYRNTDMEVVKKLRELKTEETIQQKDGAHTYIAVKFPLYDSTDRIYAIGGISTDITERKLLEEASEASNTFFMLTSEMMIIASPTHFIKVNPAAVKILGYSEEELLSKPFLDFVYTEDKISTQSQIEKLSDGSKSIQFQNRCINKDGSIKWIQWSTHRDETKKVLYTVARDITQLIENENSIKAANTFFTISLDSMIIASKEKFEKVNPAMLTILGYPEEELLKHPFIDFVFPDDKDNVQKEIDALKNGKLSTVAFKNRWVCRDHSIKWLTWSAVAEPSTGLLYAVARDITELVKLENEQKQITSQLYQNDEKLRLILENITDGIIVANADKKVILSNYVAKEMFEAYSDDEISANFADHFVLYFPDEKTIFPSQNLPMERALNGQATDDIDVILFDAASSEKRRVLISGKPLLDENKNVIAAVVTLRDISNYKKLEDTLVETETKYRKLIGYVKAKDPKNELGTLNENEATS
jgi:PAS domain S-box-containing protein